MKKNLLPAVAAAVLLLLSACDTTDTTTIRINLGGSRAGAPEDISSIYIGCFDHKTGELYSALGTLPTGSVSMVVPAKTDLYFLLMAQDKINEILYIGEETYMGAYMLVEPIGQPEGIVTIVPSLHYISSITYDYNMSAGQEENQVFLTHSGENYYSFFAPEMSYGPLFDQRSLLELHIYRENSGDTFNRIYQANYAEFFDVNYGEYIDYFSNGVPGYQFYYRSWLYVPAFGIYLFTFGETGVNLTK